ncbi:MAG: thymidylate synthase [Defluviitaleaceae bacterium]|nr:thymidylate synthase [Defluviitaleaceae bacterium]
MSKYDEVYLQIAENILENGYFGENRTINKTYKLPHQVMQFDLRKEFPILTTKKLAFKTAIKELLWIFKDQSNDVKKLQAENVHIWDEWIMQNGTIGESYGYVVKKYNQMDELLHNLKNDPQNRRMIIDLWQIPHLNNAPLHPCCFLTMWDVSGDRLNCMLVQRSGDWPLGVPFNTTQYAVLVYLLAQVSNLKPGLFTHVINNAHIYENQVQGIREQLMRKNEAYEAPNLVINKNIKDFYEFTADDINLENYKYHKAIKMEVSV